MSRFTMVIVVLVLLLVGGTMMFLGTWDLPAPSGTVEKVLADDRFPR